VRQGAAGQADDLKKQSHGKSRIRYIFPCSSPPGVFLQFKTVAEDRFFYFNRLVLEADGGKP
jgi:hypothetical protein